jgi:tetratricopeptide (TPR) repeat protein
MAIEAEPHLTGRDQIVWLDRCDREHANLRLALRWAIASGEIERAQEAAGALWRFWQQRGHITEARSWFEEVLNAPSGRERTRARAKALAGAGGIAWWQGDAAGIGEYYDEALSIAKELGDPVQIAEATYNSAFVHLRDQDYPGAAAIVSESLVLAREAGDERTVANALSMLAFQDGIVGDNDAMVAKLEEVVTILRGLGEHFHLADNLTGLGIAYTRAGRLADGRRASLEALDMFLEVDNITGVVSTLVTLAFTESWRGRHEDALRLAGASDALRESVGGGPPTDYAAFMLGDPVAEARSKLPEAAADAAWEEGRSMSLQGAVALARGQAES